MLSVIKTNLEGCKNYIKRPKVRNETIPKIWQLKYTIIPVAIIVCLIFFNLDTPVEIYIRNSFPHIVGDIFQDITPVGKASYIIIICAVILLLRLITDINKLSENLSKLFNKLSSYAGFMLATVIIGGIVGQVLKTIIGRARPKFFEEFGSHYFQHFHAPGYDFASMPSGHSITIASIAVVMMLLLPKFKYLWLLIAVIIAFSRVVVTSHYPSDVVFGFYMGTYSSLYIYYWMKNRNLIQ